VTPLTAGRLVGVALLTAGLCLGGAAPGIAQPPVPAADVYGDDLNDQFVGTGGLLLPGSVDSRTRTEVADCDGCSWRLSTPCIESAMGNPFDGEPACMSVVRGCPAMQRLLRAWFRPAAQRWREVGLVCVGSSGPVTVEQLGHRVRERFVEGIPASTPGFQPHVGVVAQLPVAFDSGRRSADVERTYRVLGEVVRLMATPRWRWEFGDGASLDTDDPGGAYPHLEVGHVYRTAGTRTVLLQTTWTARFTVDGLGPFVVPEEVEQVTRLRIDVGEGRALLTR
jgi:hypothetical protein